MKALNSRRLALAIIIVATPVLGACGINVQKDDNGRNANVDIRSPMGNLSVRANQDTPPDTGLPVHTGARALHDKESNANVNVDGGFFGVKVLVAKFEDNAAPDDILSYYKKTMASLGPVTECHGNVDFKHGRALVCKERPSSGETQLVVGEEHDHHIVSVKPRGDGTEFSLVHVQTRGNS